MCCSLQWSRDQQYLKYMGKYIDIHYFDPWATGTGVMNRRTCRKGLVNHNQNP